MSRLVLLDPAAPHQSRFRTGPTPEPVHPYTYASVEEARQALAAIDPTVTDEDVLRGYRRNGQGRWEPRFDPAIFPALVDDACEHGDRFRAELTRIRAPALCVRGERSLLDPADLGDIVAAIPDCRSVTLSGAGHFMVREQPEAVAELVLDFLGPDC